MTTRSNVKRHVVAIDLGGTRCRGALVDEALVVVAQRTVDTQTSAMRLQDQIAQLVVDFREIAQMHAAEVQGVCIGFPGVVHPVTQHIRQAPNVDDAEGHGLQQGLQALLGMPVHLDNDVNLAALAELDARAADKLQSLVLISVGTGLGAGLVVHGRLWQGRDGGAGEVCSLSPSEQGLRILRRVLPNLATPTVEDLVSGKGLARLYQALRAESAAQCLPAPFDYRQVPLLFDWAQAGDTAAQDSIQIVAEELAFAVLQLEHVLNPELVVLDGGLGAHAAFRVQVNHALRPHGLQVQASRFGSDVSGQPWATPGQAGAALLALSRLGPSPQHTLLTT